MIERRKARAVRVGGVTIGGGAPVSIQSMTKVPAADVRRTVAQVRALERAGCEIIRVAVKSPDDAAAIGAITRRIHIPLVADIHFDHRLALKAIEAGADKIRLNPGNIRRREDIAAVMRAAKRRRVPIRIGVNSGSVEREDDGASTRALVGSVGRYLRLFESFDFRDIVISLKSSNVVTTVEAYRLMAGKCGYPLHLGITASGSFENGVVKSAVGIGALLLGGIGDTIRVSLTADPVAEVYAAKRILTALGLRRFGPEVISCPTCGRCQVDLVGIVRKLEEKLSARTVRSAAKRPVTIAVMGCEVNGPGEAKDADIGIAAGKKSGVLFVKGKIVKRVAEKDFVCEVLRTIQKLS